MAEYNSANSSLCLAFVTDKETESILREINLAHLELKIEIRQGNLKEATSYLKAHRSPRILIIDISTSELPLTEIHNLGEACEPGLDVIVLGLKNDVGLFRQLLNMGIRDYIVKPITGMLIQKSIEVNVTEKNLNESEVFPEIVNKTFTSIGKSVVFIGARGGVGTTTLAANCAWSFANTFSKVTSLVDLDAQQSMIAPLLDMEAAQGFKEVLESADRIDEIFSQRVMVKQSERLYVLSAAESLTEPIIIGENTVELLSNYLLANFQYSLFDLPRFFHSPHTLQFMKQANIVVIVTDFNILSVRDTFRILKHLKENQNPKQQVFIVANKVGTYKFGELTQAAFEGAIKNKIDLVIKFDAVTPLLALNEGKPVVQKDGLLSKGISALNLLILDTEQESLLDKKSRFIDRFFLWRNKQSSVDKVVE